MEVPVEKINKKQNLRFERKFTCSGVSKSALIATIKSHPAFFREIHETRKINNIYLDTNDLEYYKLNVLGVSERKKVRIRWYGKTFRKPPKLKLEYKLKSGQLGDKWTFRLKKFKVKKGIDSEYLARQLQKSDLDNSVKEDIDTLFPTLLNTYKRTYFLSADKKFRLTLDEQMTYYYFDRKSNQFMFKVNQDSDYILELKYLPQYDNDARLITTQFPWRLSKSSKYVNGIDKTKIRQKI